MTSKGSQLLVGICHFNKEILCSESLWRRCKDQKRPKRPLCTEPKIYTKRQKKRLGKAWRDVINDK